MTEQEFQSLACHQVSEHFDNKVEWYLVHNYPLELLNNLLSDNPELCITLLEILINFQVERHCHLECLILYYCQLNQDNENYEMSGLLLSPEHVPLFYLFV